MMVLDFLSEKGDNAKTSLTAKEFGYAVLLVFNVWCANCSCITLWVFHLLWIYCIFLFLHIYVHTSLLWLI